MTLSAVIQREDDMFVATCPELDVVSQGDTTDEAYMNLQEAVELLLEDISKEELERLSEEVGEVSRMVKEFSLSLHSA